MWYIVIRELIIIVLSLSLFPVAVLLVLLHGEAVDTGLVFVFRYILSGGGPMGSIWGMLFKVISPYIAVQAIRAFLWSQRSVEGRKWAYLYFCGLLVLLSGWFFYQAWDLFYFMYALGDIPGELEQFVQLEGENVVGSVLSAALSIYCFMVFRNPTRRPRRRYGRQQS
jgi:hypothetical protein